jgi:hypothetical protein
MTGQVLVRLTCDVRAYEKQGADDCLDLACCKLCAPPASVALLLCALLYAHSEGVVRQVQAVEPAITAHTRPVRGYRPSQGVEGEVQLL